MKKIIFTIFSSVFISIFSFETAAVETYRITQYTIDEGLPDNSVRLMYQDSSGLLWFGMVNSGLCWYDGHRFGQVIDNEQINSILEDSDGHLWVTTLSGPCYCFDCNRAKLIDYCSEKGYTPKYRWTTCIGQDIWLWDIAYGCMVVHHGENGFRTVRFSEADGTIPSDGINYVEKAVGGKVWIGTANGLCLVEGDKPTTLMTGCSFIDCVTLGGADYNVTSDGRIYSLSAGRLELISRIDIPEVTVTGTVRMKNRWLLETEKDGAFIFNPGLSTVEPAPKEWSLDAGVTTHDSSGDDFVTGSSGTVLFHDHLTDEIHRIVIMDEAMTARLGRRFRFFRDSDGELWITARNFGLTRYDIATRTQEVAPINAAGDDRRINVLLYALKDRSGHLWVSSEYSGVFKLTPVSKGAAHFNFSTESNRSDIVLMSAALSQREVWFSTADRIVHVFSGDMGYRYADREYPSAVYCSILDSRGRHVAGTSGSGLFVDDVNYVHSSSDPSSICGDNITCVTMDFMGRLWIGTLENGISVGTLTDSGSYSFRSFYDEKNSGISFRDLTTDSYGNIWAATEQYGVLVFNPDELADAKTGYRSLVTEVPVGSRYTEAVFKDSRGRMWVAQTGKGLSVVTGDIRNTYGIKNYGAESGLVSVMVHDFAEDKDGCIWAMTGNGATRINPETGEVSNHILSSDMTGNQSNRGTAITLSDGRLVTGTIDGLIIINPEEMDRDNSSGRKLLLTGLTLNGQETKPGDSDYPGEEVLSRLKSITLPYNRNSFELRFSAMDFNPGTRYTYILEGYDNEWSSATSYPAASYKNVRPGRYTFRAKVSGTTGSENEISVPIRIKAPLYASIYALIFYILLIATSIWLVMRDMNKRNKKSAEAEMEERFTDYKATLYGSVLQGFKAPVSKLTEAMGSLKTRHEEALGSDRNFKAVERDVARLSGMIARMEKNTSLQMIEAEPVPEIHPAAEVTSADSAFLARIDQILEKHLDDQDFTVDEFAKELSMGRTAFYNKVSTTSGYSPNNYIRMYRMKKAAELLTAGKHTAAEVGFMVGVRDASYFTKLFKDQFGMTPKEYQRKFTIFA